MDKLGTEHPNLQSAILYALEETARTLYPQNAPSQPEDEDSSKIDEEGVPTLKPGADIFEQDEEEEEEEQYETSEQRQRTQALRFFANKLLEHKRAHGYGVNKYDTTRDRDALARRPKQQNKRRSSIDASLVGIQDEGEGPAT